MKNLILSLQGNGGGYLNAAVELADEFLSRDKLVVYTQGIRQPKKISNATGVGNFETGKLIILVDEYSASASEIVSGAVQDWDRGVIIGRRTFGKGLVQGQLPLPDGSMLRLTTARYYTPSGRYIQKPYKNRADKYERDIQTRMKNGELFHADSIHFPDSLKYETLTLKRTVYGGGGIMPDVFVPADTTKYTEYHRNLVSRGVLNNVVARYVNNNRDLLKKEYSTFDKYNKKFVTNDELIAKLVAAGEKENIARNEDQLKISEPLIKLQIKALIARDLWDMNSYYKIIDAENESLQRALEILNTPGAYEKILSSPAAR
jgi:carboxyl-terminal processing protease